LHEEFPSDSYVRTHEIPLEAPAGSVVVLDGMTFHRAGVNSTKNFVRRAVNNVVGLPFMGQQIDIPDFWMFAGSIIEMIPSFLNIRLSLESRTRCHSVAARARCPTITNVALRV